MKGRGSRNVPGATAKYTGPLPSPSRKPAEMGTVPELSTPVEGAVQNRVAPWPSEPCRKRVLGSRARGGKIVDTSSQPRRNAPGQAVDKWTTPGENSAGSVLRRANSPPSFSADGYSLAGLDYAAGNGMQTSTE